MADIVNVAAEVRAMIENGALVFAYSAAGAGSLGDWVYLDTSGTVLQADADAIASAKAIGIVTGIGVRGNTTFASGDRVEVCRYGPVVVGTGVSMTIGQPLYVSTTAGSADQTIPPTSGDFPFIVGTADAANIVFVNPQTALPVSN